MHGSPQGDTLENVSQELDYIIDTGYYTLECGEERHVVGSETLRCLEYSVHAQPTSSDQEHGEQPVDGQRMVHRVKNSEQVRDFLMKLGFLNRDDTEGDRKNRAKDFLHLSQVFHSLCLNLFPCSNPLLLSSLPPSCLSYT
jgi:hypothetical protein